MFINFNCIYIYKYQTWIVVEYKLPLLIQQIFLQEDVQFIFSDSTLIIFLTSSFDFNFITILLLI